MESSDFSGTFNQRRRRRKIPLSRFFCLPHLSVHWDISLILCTLFLFLNFVSFFSPFFIHWWNITVFSKFSPLSKYHGRNSRNTQRHSCPGTHIALTRRGWGSECARALLGTRTGAPRHSRGRPWSRSWGPGARTDHLCFFFFLFVSTFMACFGKLQLGLWCLYIYINTYARFLWWGLKKYGHHKLYGFRSPLSFWSKFHTVIIKESSIEHGV